MNALAYPSDDQEALSPRYAYHQDAGHGWLEVPTDLIDQLGLTQTITRYSYQNAGRTYLEEDMDMGAFIGAYKTRFGHAPEIFEPWTPKQPDYSAIRDYAPYTPVRYKDRLKSRA